MILKLFFPLLLLLIASCQSSSLNICKDPSNLGSTHGSLGITYKEDYFIKKCKRTANFKTLYTQSLHEGLEKYCSEKKGSEQALNGLQKEASCSEFPKYNQGYQNQLEITCTKQLAKKDAKALLNSNKRPCLEIKTYTQEYNRLLNIYCSHKKAYNLGKEKKNLGQACSDVRNYSSFKQSYLKGLSDYYSSLTTELEKQISSLKQQQQQIKEKINSSPQSHDLRIHLNKIESRILKLQHEIELNKGKINSAL